MHKKRGFLFIVSAPSGAGKTSLTNYVIEQLADEFPLEKIITTTTRSPRDGEIDGVDYHFVSSETFLSMKEHGDFLETTTYNGNLYGSPAAIKQDLDHGKSFFVVVDRTGAKRLKKLIDNPILIWLSIPDLNELTYRIQQRGSSSQEEIEARIALAAKELNDEAMDPSFTHYVCNDNFQQAAQKIIVIIRQTMNQIQ